MRRWLLVPLILAFLTGGVALVPGHFGLLGQPSVSFTSNGNLPPAAHSAEPTPGQLATPPTVAAKPPCIQPGAVSQDNANVPFRSPSHPSPLFKQAPDDFGPPPGTKEYDLTGKAGELKFRLCPGQAKSHGFGVGPDQRLYAALSTMVNGGNPNSPMPEATWVRQVKQFVNHDIQWNNVALEQHCFATPWTELMIPGRNPQIYLVPGTVHCDLFLRVPVLARNGQTKILWLRPECGYQPYADSPTDFPSSVPVATVADAYTAGAPALVRGCFGPPLSLN